MPNNYSSLPEPAPFARAAVVNYEWGDQKFEIVCSACTVRFLEWEDTGEEVAWLHCKAMRTAEVNPDELTDMMTVLIPTRFVTAIKPGLTFRIVRSGKTTSIGIFPPTHPAAQGNLPLTEIDKALAAFLTPERN